MSVTFNWMSYSPTRGYSVTDGVDPLRDQNLVHRGRWLGGIGYRDSYGGVAVAEGVPVMTPVGLNVSGARLPLVTAKV